MNEFLNKWCTKVRENEWQINTSRNTFLVKKSQGEYGLYLQNRGSVTKIGVLESEQDVKALFKIII